MLERYVQNGKFNETVSTHFPTLSASPYPVVAHPPDFSLTGLLLIHYCYTIECRSVINIVWCAFVKERCAYSINAKQRGRSGLTVGLGYSITPLQLHRAFPEE